MLKGDLTSTPLAPLLRDLAADTATGCLHVTNPAGEEALIYMKNGLVYSVSVPGTRPQLGAKLVSSGALAPEALAEALEAQRSELQGWRLGELLVHLGYVDQPVVEAFIMEQVTEALWDLLRWTEGRWKFRKNIRAREDIGPPMVVVELLATLRDRGYEWENISAVVHGPAAVPVLSARGGASPETTLDNDAWSMLCKIDGERSVADLARDCGYTLFEAGQIMVSLVQAGLVDIDEDIDLAGSELYGATTLSSALAGDLDDEDAESSDDEPAERDTSVHPTDAEKEDVLARLARLVNEVAGDHGLDEATNGDHAADSDDDESGDGGSSGPSRSMPAVALAPPLQSGVTSFDNPMIVPLHRHSSESFAASIARVSNALSDVLGETPDAAESESSTSNKPVALKRSRSSTSDPEWQRRKRLRSAAAAELASAQAMVETLRADREVGDLHEVDGELTTGDEAQLESVDPSDALAAEHVAEALVAEQAEADRVAAEEAAAQEAEAERVAAEQSEAEREAAEREAADIAAAEQAAAEQLAAEQAERLAAEHAELAATEESAWAEYWQREGDERAEAERIAAEQAEAERIAAEEAEAERVAAEQVEAERIAAEQAEAERVAAEQAEAERIAAEEQAEAERIAAEQAEAERIAAEEQAEAERIAAEEADAERVAAEEQAEAERIAAEQAEAERIAAEEQAEAERIAAEQAEAERVATEQAEAERIAAEEADAERVAAEEAEAERVAAEEAEAERIAAERAAQDDSDRVAAQDAESGIDDTSATSSSKEEKARRKAERQIAEDEARQADEAAAATALLVELAATSQAEAEQATASAPDDETVADDDEPAEDAEEPWTEAGQADTAALLRELSSLGMDDDEPTAPTTTPAAQQRQRPTPVDKKTKKKIGLFGL